MRANTVWIGGLGMAGIGGAGLAIASQWMQLGEPRATLSAVFMAMLAMGVILACLGTLLTPRRLYRSKPARRALFGDGDAPRKTGGRNFGQRADYGKLGPREDRVAAGKPEYRQVTGPTRVVEKTGLPAIRK